MTPCENLYSREVFYRIQSEQSILLHTDMSAVVQSSLAKQSKLACRFSQICLQRDVPSKRRLTFLLSSDQVFTRWRVLCPPSHAEASKAILFELLNRVRRIKSWYSGRFQKLTAFTSSHDRRKFLPGDRQSSLSFHR